jgi:hypothetical protein
MTRRDTSTSKSDDKAEGQGRKVEVNPDDQGCVRIIKAKTVGQILAKPKSLANRMVKTKVTK